MILDNCRGCGNKSEIIKDGLCENCLDKRTMAEQSQKPEVMPNSNPGSQTYPVVTPQTPPRSDLTDKLLTFIIQNATDDFINNLVKRHAKNLKESYGWINLIQKVNDEKVLLRIATELGHGAEDIKLKKLKEEYETVMMAFNKQKVYIESLENNKISLEKALENEQRKNENSSPTGGNGIEAETKGKPSGVLHPERKTGRVHKENTK